MTDIKELFLKVIIGSKTIQNNIFSFYFFLKYILKFINISCSSFNFNFMLLLLLLLFL